MQSTQLENMWRLEDDFSNPWVTGWLDETSMFFCLWDSRADNLHYTQISWQSRTSFTPGLQIVKSACLVDPQNIFLPPLHIKFGLMKNYIKALDKDGPTFRFLRRKFPRISEAKL